MAVLSFRDQVDTISAINHKGRWQPKCTDSHEYMVVANIFVRILEMKQIVRLLKYYSVYVIR